MFGRATIRLGIGPHSGIFSYTAVRYCSITELAPLLDEEDEDLTLTQTLLIFTYTKRSTIDLILDVDKFVNSQVL